MQRVPTPLWIYAAVGGVSWVVALSLETNIPLPAAVGTSAIGLILFNFLLRGSRVVWVFLVLSEAISLLTAPFVTPAWWTILLGVFSLGCLLIPSTRRYVWRPRPAKPGRNGDTKVTSDPEPHQDSDGRPRGWYLDPDDPGRMRYWMGEELGWSRKSIRAPKKAGAAPS